jgi:hypothetical protein
MRGRRSPSCRAVGLRRVSWVVVTVDGDRVHAAAAGVCHRLPRTVPIPVKDAMRLAADGVPVVVRRTPAAATA